MPIGYANIPYTMGSGMKDRYSPYVGGALQLPTDLGGGRFEHTLFDRKVGKPQTYTGSDSGNLWKKGLGIGAAMFGTGALLSGGLGGMLGGLGSKAPTAAGGLWPMDAGMKAGGGLLGGLGGLGSKVLGGIGSAGKGLLGGVGNALGVGGLDAVANALDAVDVKGGTGGSSHRSGPWEGLTPYLGDLYGQAQNIYQRGPQQSQYMDALGGYAMNNLNPGMQVNPMLNQMFNQAANRIGEQFRTSVLPGVHSAFSGAGRTGGGLHTQAVGQAAGRFGDTLSNLATNLYGGAFEDAARRQQQQSQFAASLLPQMAQWNDPYRHLQGYANIIQRNPFTQSRATSKQGLGFSIGL